jgi:5-methylcytosine-specific restriction endonuclease McrA
MTIRNGAYEWKGHRSFCKQCALTDSKTRAYLNRVRSITHIPPYVAPSEREVSSYKERIAQVGELPPYYTAEELRQQKNARSRAHWYANHQAQIARKRAYNAREEVKEHYREYGAEYRQTPKGKAIHLDTENRRRSRKRHNGEENLAWFYQAVRELPLVMCHICGTWLHGSDCHVDHVIPLARGGNHTRDNLATACPTCNLRKSSRLDWESLLVS